MGTDEYFYGIMPLVMQVGEIYGVASLNTALTMLIGKNLALMVSPLVPATYLAIGLTGTELITIGEDTTEADLQKFFMK